MVGVCRKTTSALPPMESLNSRRDQDQSVTVPADSRGKQNRQGVYHKGRFTRVAYTGRTLESNDGCLHAGEAEKLGAEGGWRPPSGATGQDYGVLLERSFIPEFILPGKAFTDPPGGKTNPPGHQWTIHTAIQRIRWCFGQPQGGAGAWLSARTVDWYTQSSGLQPSNTHAQKTPSRKNQAQCGVTRKIQGVHRLQPSPQRGQSPPAHTMTWPSLEMSSNRQSMGGGVSCHLSTQKVGAGD